LFQKHDFSATGFLMAVLVKIGGENHVRRCSIQSKVGVR